MLISLPLFRGSIAYGVPGSMSLNIEKGLNITDGELGELYSYYNIPNVILPILSGLVVDVIGIRLSLVLLWVLTWIGAIISAIGTQIGSYTALASGQFILGAGLESGFVPLDGAFRSACEKNFLFFPIISYTVYGGLTTLSLPMVLMVALEALEL